jgi:hypothetical protein
MVDTGQERIVCAICFVARIAHAMRACKILPVIFVVDYIDMDHFLRG